MDIGMILSIAVMILSALVMLLIGWNIWAAIDVKRTLKEYDKKMLLLAEQTDLHTSELSKAVYGVMSKFHYDADNAVEFLRYSLLNLLFIAKLKDEKQSEIVINNIIETKDVWGKCITQKEKAELLDVAYKVRHLNTGRVDEVIELILSA